MLPSHATGCHRLPEIGNRLATALPLSIIPFRNRSGTLSYRVSGTLRGERIRKNFNHEVDAQTWLNKNVAGIISAIPVHPVLTTLTEDQARQAEAALTLLPIGTDLIQAVTYFAQYHRPLTPLPFAAAVAVWGEWQLTQRKNEGGNRQNPFRIFAAI